MAESPPTPNRRHTALQLLLRVPVYLFISLTMYVLSIGPMYWRWYESYAMHSSHEEALMYADRVSLFYLPLLKACEKSEHISDYVNWYIDFWV
jgi:hypothetical protein